MRSVIWYRTINFRLKFTKISFLTKNLGRNAFVRTCVHESPVYRRLMYTAKIVLLSPQVAKSDAKILLKGQLNKLEVFLKFVMYAYLPWWITATVPESAPCHDLNLINSILQFKEINQRAAKGALKGIGNHLWYLTEELLPLSLFSNNVLEDTKAKIAKTILSSGPEAKSIRTGASHGKPVFPTMPERVNEDLVQFVGPSNIKFFNIMRLDPGFLSLPVEITELDSSFNKAKLTVSNLMVVNDAASMRVSCKYSAGNGERKGSSSRHDIEGETDKGKEMVSPSTVLCFKSVKLTSAV